MVVPKDSTDSARERDPPLCPSRVVPKLFPSDEWLHDIRLVVACNTERAFRSTNYTGSPRNGRVGGEVDVGFARFSFFSICISLYCALYSLQVASCNTF